MMSIPKNLEHLLDTESGERKVVQFLTENAQLLCDYFVNPRK